MSGFVITVLALLFIGGCVAGFFWTWHRNREDDASPFESTDEAWAARRVIPGETREQARKRLAKYRVR